MKLSIWVFIERLLLYIKKIQLKKRVCEVILFDTPTIKSKKIRNAKPYLLNNSEWLPVANSNKTNSLSCIL